MRESNSQTWLEILLTKSPSYDDQKETSLRNGSLCLGVLIDLVLALADSVTAIYVGKKEEQLVAMEGLLSSPPPIDEFCFKWQKDLLGNEYPELIFT